MIWFNQEPQSIDMMAAQTLSQQRCALVGSLRTVKDQVQVKFDRRAISTVLIHNDSSSCPFSQKSLYSWAFQQSFLEHSTPAEFPRLLIAKSACKPPIGHSGPTCMLCVNTELNERFHKYDITCACWSLTDSLSNARHTMLDESIQTKLDASEIT